MAGAVVPNVMAAGRHPGHVVGYSKQNPVAGALLIWIGLIAIGAIAQATRTGKVTLPNQQGVVSLAVASLAVVLAAKLAPRLVAWVLLAILVVTVATNASAVTNWVQKGFANVQRAVPRGTTGG